MIPPNANRSSWPAPTSSVRLRPRCVAKSKWLYSPAVGSAGDLPGGSSGEVGTMTCVPKVRCSEASLVEDGVRTLRELYDPASVRLRVRGDRGVGDLLAAET